MFVCCLFVFWFFVLVFTFTICVAYLALMLTVLMYDGDGTVGVCVECVWTCVALHPWSLMLLFSWFVACIHTVWCLMFVLVLAVLTLFCMLAPVRAHSYLCSLCDRGHSRCLCSWSYWSGSSSAVRVRVSRVLDVRFRPRTYMSECVMCVCLCLSACVIWCECTCMCHECLCARVRVCVCVSGWV